MYKMPKEILNRIRCGEKRLFEARVIEVENLMKNFDEDIINMMCYPSDAMNGSKFNYGEAMRAGDAVAMIVFWLIMERDCSTHKGSAEASVEFFSKFKPKSFTDVAKEVKLHSDNHYVLYTKDELNEILEDNEEELIA